MKILDLSLTYHWYDEIASGRKPEEYRRITPFYQSRMMNGYNPSSCKNKRCTFCKSRLTGTCTPIEYDAIRFHRGQGSKTTMLIEWKGMGIGAGCPEWGAPEKELVFITLLGRILPETTGTPFFPFHR